MKEIKIVIKDIYKSIPEIERTNILIKNIQKIAKYEREKAV